jgi:hypothetical protein
MMIMSIKHKILNPTTLLLPTTTPYSRKTSTGIVLVPTVGLLLPMLPVRTGDRDDLAGIAIFQGISLTGVTATGMQL